MKLRTGLYTIYRGAEMQLLENRVEVPQTDPLYTLLAPIEHLSGLDDFFVSPDGNSICKTINLSSIDNAFWIDTCGIYRAHEVQVFNGNKTNVLRIASSDKDVAKAVGLVQVDTNWFVQDVPNYAVDNLKERYSSTKLDKPFPESLPSEKQL